MRLTVLWMAVFGGLAAASCRSTGVQPPRPAAHPVTTALFNDARTDDYAWLRERENAEVIAHLEAENAYFDAMMARTARLQDTLYEEMLSRIVETDDSVPERDGDWWYYDRTEEGLDYALLCRRPWPDGPEQVYLDINELAEPHAYYDLTRAAVSPDHRVLAFMEDTSGDDLSDLRFMDMDTGRIWNERVPSVSSFSLTFDATGQAVYYTKPDATRRPYQVWRHRLGTSFASDELLYEETDGRFFVTVDRTLSRDWIVISTESSTSSEMYAVDARDASAKPLLIHARQPGVELSGLAHQRAVAADGAAHAGWFYTVTTKDAINGQLIRKRVGLGVEAPWEVVVPHDPAVQLNRVQITATHRILTQRRDGLRQVRVSKHDSTEEHAIAFDEPVGVVYADAGAMYDTPTIRVHYSSPLTPERTYDYDPDTRELTLLKQDEVPSGFDFDRYTVDRLQAIAPDGVRVPMTVVRSKDMVMDNATPTLLTAYGSYGASSEPSFDEFIGYASLLERGGVVAIAHIRGGGEMGRTWRDDGKFLRKMNTFTDFIACAEKLFSDGYTRADRLAIRGGSAGGLLVGAVINLRPDLCRVVVADVPFVDSLNTMLDPSLPLTVGEYEEWGNPNDEVYYRYMRSYAPYEQVGPRAYPDVLATGGLNDPRVPYWEPAKWVAKLRDQRTNDGLTLLHIHMDSGHGGSSGRYDSFYEEAQIQAFILDRLGIKR